MSSRVETQEPPSGLHASAPDDVQRRRGVAGPHSYSRVDARSRWPGTRRSQRTVGVAQTVTRKIRGALRVAPDHRHPQPNETPQAPDSHRTRLRTPAARINPSTAKAIRPERRRDRRPSGTFERHPRRHAVVRAGADLAPTFGKSERVRTPHACANLRARPLSGCDGVLGVSGGAECGFDAAGERVNELGELARVPQLEGIRG